MTKEPQNPPERPAQKRTVMGALDVLGAVFMLGCVWIALPARWMPIDAGFTLLAMLLAASGVGLLTQQPWAEKVALYVASLTLVVGLCFVTALGYTVGSLSGLYGPVGMGGATILAIVAALLLPYLIVFPAAQVYFLLPARNAPKPDAPVAVDKPRPRRNVPKKKPEPEPKSKSKSESKSKSKSKSTGSGEEQ